METAQFNDWKFSSLQTHISLSTEIDELAKQLRFVPPEQLYLSNFLKFEHPRVQIRFSAQDALQTVPHDDWTFIPRNYFGKFERDGVDLEKVDDENAKIDMDLLMKKDPILFYSSVVLFEDELHDHGHCTLSVKTRVMQSCFLILLRYWLRLDKERMVIQDTRIFHKFGSSEIIFEVSHAEETFENLEKRGLCHLPGEYPNPDSAVENLIVNLRKKYKLMI